MRILLTNDDGIDSRGLSLLARALREAGHRVFVVAPDSDRSGVSHSISFLREPCKLTEREKDTWSCSGTPADCVVVASLGGVPELDGLPDLVVSGINRGANIGTDIVYSGTAAAARQGGLCGIPSLALSLVEGDSWNWEGAVNFSLKHLAEIIAYRKPETFVNVNIPNIGEEPGGLVPAFPSLRCYTDRVDPYEAHDGSRYCFSTAGKIGTWPERGSDWDAVSRNLASMSAVFIHPVSLEEVITEKGRAWNGRKTLAP
ncbi:MAG: 5'/3'-nucleotidase SurE [Treponema sp.]|jgi:5'-nucleotidase|nr:5'/3'-nucleotidase SurE [Treponema sp.]